jgi:hypothetical protein
VWKTFGKNPEVTVAFRKAGFTDDRRSS